MDPDANVDDLYAEQEAVCDNWNAVHGIGGIANRKVEESSKTPAGKTPRIQIPWRNASLGPKLKEILTRVALDEALEATPHGGVQLKWQKIADIIFSHTSFQNYTKTESSTLRGVYKTMMDDTESTFAAGTNLSGQSDDLPQYLKNCVELHKIRSKKIAEGVDIKERKKKLHMDLIHNEEEVLSAMGTPPPGPPPKRQRQRSSSVSSKEGGSTPGGTSTPSSKGGSISYSSTPDATDALASVLMEQLQKKNEVDEWRPQITGLQEAGGADESFLRRFCEQAGATDVEEEALEAVGVDVVFEALLENNNMKDFRAEMIANLDYQCRNVILSKLFAYCKELACHGK